MYEITYDYEDERNIRETFEGSWAELQEYIKQMRATGCYKKLVEDLKAAIAYGQERKGDDDGGTSNFDSPTLCLPGWKKELVEIAARTAGTSCSTWKPGRVDFYVFGVPGVGQGYTRTNAAEAFRDYLEAQGYDAGMYYQMD